MNPDEEILKEEMKREPVKWDDLGKPSKVAAGVLLAATAVIATLAIGGVIVRIGEWAF